MSKKLEKILQHQRDRYHRKVSDARNRMHPTKEEMARARVAATPPLLPTPGEYRRRSRSALWMTVLMVCGIWLLHMAWAAEFHLFIKNWFMSVTMVVGSFIAGSTSAGGGAVAFPVMTLIFDISPACARNFSMAIQAVGMSAAAIAIWRCRIPVERNAILFSSLGGALGIVGGTFLVVPLFTIPAFTKMFFAALWLSFAVALYLINRDREREIFYNIVDFKAGRAGAVLILVGILGGIITSLTGSGLDMLTFAFLTLRYRICEKVATPTSVILMAFNSMVGFATHLFLTATPGDGGSYWMGDFEMGARNYWLVCIPVVIIGAPAGARFIKDRSRLFVASLLYITIFIQFVAALVVLRPTGWLLGFAALIFGIGSCLFLFLAVSGKNRIDLKIPLFEERLKS